MRTLVSYPGQPHQRVEEIYHSQAKSGTTHFHADATAYIVRRDQCFTVALIRVEHGTVVVEVLGDVAGAQPGHPAELSGIVSDGVSLDEVERVAF